MILHEVLMKYFPVTVRYYFKEQLHDLIKQEEEKEQVKGKLKASYLK